MSRLPLDLLLATLPSPPRHVLSRLVQGAVDQEADGDEDYRLQPYLRRRPRLTSARLRPVARGSCHSMREDRRAVRSRKRKRHR